MRVPAPLDQGQRLLAVQDLLDGGRCWRCGASLVCLLIGREGVGIGLRALSEGAFRLPVVSGYYDVRELLCLFLS